MMPAMIVRLGKVATCDGCHATMPPGHGAVTDRQHLVCDETCLRAAKRRDAA